MWQRLKVRDGICRPNVGTRPELRWLVCRESPHLLRLDGAIGLPHGGDHAEAAPPVRRLTNHQPTGHTGSVRARRGWAMVWWYSTVACSRRRQSGSANRAFRSLSVRCQARVHRSAVESVRLRRAGRF